MGPSLHAALFPTIPEGRVPQVVWRNRLPHVRLGNKLVAIRDARFWEFVQRDMNEERRRGLCSLAAQLEPASAFRNDVEFRADIGALDVL